MFPIVRARQREPAHGQNEPDRSAARAVGKLGNRQVSGFLAWWVWWIVRLAYLVGWAWQYLVFSRGARLITGRAWEQQRQNSDQRPR